MSTPPKIIIVRGSLVYHLRKDETFTYCGVRIGAEDVETDEPPEHRTPCHVCAYDVGVALTPPAPARDGNDRRAPLYSYFLAVVFSTVIFLGILLITGLVWMNFGKGASLLAGGELWMLSTGILYLLAYGLIGFCFGKWWPLVGWRWGLWMASPILGLVILSTISNHYDYRQSYLIELLFPIGIVAVFTLVPASLGALLGIRHARRKARAR